MHKARIAALAAVAGSYAIFAAAARADEPTKGSVGAAASGSASVSAPVLPGDSDHHKHEEGEHEGREHRRHHEHGDHHEHGEHDEHGEHHDRGRVRLTYSDGTFWLRAPHDEVTLFPTGRAQLDGYTYFGPGVDQYQRTDLTGLSTNFAFKRVTLEFGGTIGKHLYWLAGANFGPSAIDASQSPVSKVAPYQVFVGWEPFVDTLRLQAGQFPIPFTMENITNTRYTSFMEFAQPVRSVGAPNNMDLGVMALGSLGGRLIDYQLGVFGGGGANRPSVDGRPDVVGRVIARPLKSLNGALSNAHVGASFRWGRRNVTNDIYDAPTMSTGGGYAFWIPEYGKGGTLEHIIPWSNQIGVAAELYVPFERVDITGEFIYVNEGRRETSSGNFYQTERLGTFKGIAYYAQVDIWPWGTPHIGGEPGTYARPRVPHPTASLADPSLQVALRWEQLLLSYDSIDQCDPTSCQAGTLRGNLDSHGDPSAGVPATDIKANVLSAAVTFWATRLVRVTAQYSLYMFPGTGPLSYNLKGEGKTPPDTGTYNQAQAPGQRFGAYQDAHELHEVSLRFQAAF